MTRPTIVYDDDCGFCTWSAEYADRRGSFEVVGFSELTPELAERLPTDYENCVHLLVDDAVYSCGRATEEVLIRLDAPARYPARAFRRLPGRASVREPLYRLVADNRDLAGKVARREPPARRREE